MFVDLLRVPPEGQVLDRSMAPVSISLASNDFRLTRNVDLTGRLVRVKQHAFRLRGELVSTIEVECVRCLEPFAMNVHEELDLLYLPQSANVALEGEEDRGLEREELAVSFYRDGEIDLGHMVWEQIMLSLPMKPLCRPECQGLCSECGCNRNVTSCGCVRDETDPRWAALKGLLER